MDGFLHMYKDLRKIMVTRIYHNYGDYHNLARECLKINMSRSPCIN